MTDRMLKIARHNLQMWEDIVKDQLPHLGEDEQHSRAVRFCGMSPGLLYVLGSEMGAPIGPGP